MRRIRTWLLARIFGNAPNQPPAGVDGVLREDHPGWGESDLTPHIKQHQQIVQELARKERP